MAKKDNAFNVMLSTEQKNMLNQLAESLNCSKGQTFRFMLIAAYQMKFKDTPTCANGSRCFVPHMHGKADVDAANPQPGLPARPRGPPHLTAPAPAAPPTQLRGGTRPSPDLPAATPQPGRRLTRIRRPSPPNLAAVLNQPPQPPHPQGNYKAAAARSRLPDPQNPAPAISLDFSNISQAPHRQKGLKTTSQTPH